MEMALVAGCQSARVQLVRSKLVSSRTVPSPSGQARLRLVRDVSMPKVIEVVVSGSGRLAVMGAVVAELELSPAELVAETS